MPALRQTLAAKPHAAANAPTGRPEPQPEAGPAVPRALSAMEEAAAKAVALAKRHDFGKPLALASDNYAALEQCVKDVRAAAGQFHSEWEASGNRACLAAAQGLGIKGALLHALHAMRLHHKEWLGPTPVASPQGLAYVLPLFREALSVCEKHSGAVQFPIHGLDPALAYLQQQVEASRHSLETGQWQGSPDGQWHAQRQRGTPAAARQEADPFARVKADCQDLREVVQQLRDTLALGPAPRRAAPPVAAGVVAPQAQAPEPAPGLLAPQAQEPAAATPLPTWERSFTAVLLAGLQVSQPLEARPQPRTPVAPMVTGTPASPAGGLARLRQEQVDALRAALAEAGRLGEQAAPAGHAPGPAAAPSWADHSRAFQAWQAAARACQACGEKLAAEAGTEGSLGSSDPAVQGLRQEIHHASGNVLDQAARAARDTLAAFSKTCHDALAQKDAQAAGLPSHAELQRHCRDLQQQWLDAPLRPHLPELEAHIAKYNAYEVACNAMAKDPDSIADALYKAEQLRPAAGQQVYAQLRNDLLRKAAYTESQNLNAAYEELGTALMPATRARYGAAMAFDVLLVGGPLPDKAEGASASSREPLQAHSILPEGEPALAEEARRVAESAYRRREQSLELKLPADAPQQAIRDLQAAQASLHQMRLTAQATAATLGGFHDLAAAFGRTRPTEWPAIARQHADAMRQLNDDLALALQTQQKLARQPLDPTRQQLLKHCSMMLHTDRPLVARAKLALETLSSLLALRVSANQALRRIVGVGEQQPRLAKLACPEFTGEPYDKAAAALAKDKRAIEKLLQKGVGNLPQEIRQLEAHCLQQSALALGCRIDCDRFLVQGELLLSWAAEARKPGSGYLHDRESISATLEMIDQRSKALALINKQQLTGAVASSALGNRYQTQIDINQDVRARLEQLHEALGQDLRRMLSTAATGPGGPGHLAAQHRPRQGRRSHHGRS